MSKKRKSQARSQAQTSSTVASMLGKSTPATMVPRTTSPDFNPDYTYIRKDLRRIGILAGTLFGILIVLSFFI